MTDAQYGLFLAQLFGQLMERAGEDIYPVHIRRLGYQFSPIAQFLAAGLFRDGAHMTPYQTVDAGQTGECVDTPGETLSHVLAVGVQ